MRRAKHSARAQTQRTDVEWTDGIPYCQTCSYAVNHDDTCGPECAQTELAKVLKYIGEQRVKSTRFNTDYEGSVYDALGEIIAELSGGEHRRAAPRRSSDTLMEAVRKLAEWKP